jgi:hypothetical protein
MSALAIVALVLVCAWLGVLTFVVVLLVRQIGLLTVRLSVATQAISLDDDGHRFEQSVVALVPGREEQAGELAALLPTGIRVVLDPEATQLAESLDLESTPFAIEVEGGTVTSKVHLFGGASALLEFVESGSARNGGFVEISEKEAIEGR